MSVSPLRRYQRDGVRGVERFLVHRKRLKRKSGPTYCIRALCADEMGLGKTIEAELARRRLKPDGPVIILCPAHVKYNWEVECRTAFRWRKRGKIYRGCQAKVIEGTKPPKRTWEIVPKVIIINYDILGKWLRFLIKLNPQLLIIDESHYLQNRAAKRTRYARRLSKRVPHIVALSGTPLTNRPAELWPILNILRPDKFRSFWSFAVKHCKPRRRPWAWEFKGAEKLGLLHRRLKKILMIRRLLQDVLTEIPQRQRIVKAVGIVNRREYDRAFNDFLRWLAKQDKRKAHRAKKAERLTKIGYLKRLIPELKLPSMIKWLESYLEESDGKIIVFAIHKKIVKAIHKAFPGISCVLNGDIVGRERQRVVDRFKKNSRIRIIISSVPSGWNGQIADTVAFTEMFWRPGDHTQGEGRAVRFSQMKSVRCVYLVARNTYEEDLCEIIQLKQRNIGRTLDGKKGGDKLQVFDLLCQKLLKGAHRGKSKAQKARAA